MIDIKEFIDKFLSGKNAKYAVILCIGLMLLVASSSFSTGIGASKGEQLQTEKKLTQILKEIDGVGDVDVMISSKNNEAEGVIIVAQGAENPAVKKKIYDAASAALGVKPHKIEVFSKKRGE